MTKKRYVAKMEAAYPDLEMRQAAMFEKLPALKRDYDAAMREAQCDPCIWERVYGQFVRVGQLPKHRAKVYQLLRDKGWSYPVIAYATQTRCHTTVITALQREAATA